MSMIPDLRYTLYNESLYIEHCFIYVTVSYPSLKPGTVGDGYLYTVLMFIKKMSEMASKTDAVCQTLLFYLLQLGLGLGLVQHKEVTYAVILITFNWKQASIFNLVLASALLAQSTLRQFIIHFNK